MEGRCAVQPLTTLSVDVERKEDSMSLADKRCVPCEGGTKPMDEAEAVALLKKEIPDWSLKDGHLFREFRFGNFKEAISFVNKVAEIAEEEDHHPGIRIDYNKVGIELWTHAIGGLSGNDFIVAAKIDKSLL